MSCDIFISYASENKIIADEVVSALEKWNLRCWIAPRDILPGKDYADSIINAIDKSHILILIFSSHSNNSPHVKSEVRSAFDKGKIIIPFRIENVEPTSTMEHFIGSFHWFDALTQPLNEYIIIKFVMAVSKHLNKKPAFEADSRDRIETLLGRGNDIDEILKLIKKHSVAVTGISGIGKSMVVSAIFETVRKDTNYPYDICYWRSFAHKQQSFSEFGRQLLKDFNNEDINFDRIDIRDQINIVIRTLKEYHIFMVIDQFETIIDRKTLMPRDEGFKYFLDYVNQGLENSRLVITSWEVPMDSRGISLCHFMLKGLDIPSGIRLIEDLRGSAMENNHKTIYEALVNKLEGHPLVLKLIARENYSISEIQDIVNDSEIWHLTITEIAAKIISKIYNDLTQESKKVLSAACIFLKPFDRYNTSFVSEIQNTFTILHDLRHRGLITEVQEGKYEIHILVKEYVLNQLSADEKKNLHYKAATFYRRQPYPPPKARKSIDDIYPLLEAVEHLILANKFDEAGNLFISEELNEELHSWSHLIQLKQICEKLLEKKLPEETLCILFGNLGLVYRDSGDFNKATVFCEKALNIATSCHFKKGEIIQLVNLGDIYFYRGESDKSMGYHLQAMENLKTFPDRKLEARNLGCLGNCFLGKKDYQQAKVYYKQALDISERIGERWYEGIWLGNLGNVEEDVEEKIKYFKRAIDIAIESGDRRHESQWNGVLGSEYCRQKDYDKAIDYLSKALFISERIMYRRGMRIQIEWMAETYYHHISSINKSNVNELDNAINFLKHAQDLISEDKSYENKNDAQSVIKATYNAIGNVFLKLGRTEAYGEYLNKGIENYTRAIDIEPESSLYKGRANCYAYIGSLDEAISDYGKAINMDPINIGAILSKMEVQVWNGKYSDARITYNQLPTDILSSEEKLVASWLMSLSLALDGLPFDNYVEKLRNSDVKIKHADYDATDMKPYIDKLKGRGMPQDRIDNALMIHNLFLQQYIENGSETL